MVLAYCFLFESFPAPSLFSDMELELSLGVSPALAKGTALHILTCTSAGDREGHDELVLELGARTAKGDELDNLKTSMQPEDVQEDLYQGCPQRTACAETGIRIGEVRYLYE